MPECGSQCILCDLPIRFDNYEGCAHSCEYCFVKRKNTIVKIKDRESPQSLKDFMNRNMSIKEVIKLGIDVCEGLDSLSKCNIIHGNVKPSNIFIGSDGKYKIGDFKIDNYQSNSLYIAPEVYYQKLVVNKCDTYALGLIMYQLLNKGKLPFVSMFVNDTKALKFRMAGKNMTPIKGVEPELMNIILKACCYTDTYRYNDPYMMANALRHYRDKKYNDKDIITLNAFDVTTILNNSEVAQLKIEIQKPDYG